MTSKSPSRPERSAAEAFDTNVVVRLLVLDDEDQCRRAEAVWRRAIAAGGAWISTVVLVELGWVLRTAYRFDRFAAAAALRRLVSSDGVVVEDPQATAWVLDAFERGPADLSDYVILYAARRANAAPLWTFDERLAAVSGAAAVP